MKLFLSLLLLLSAYCSAEVRVCILGDSFSQPYYDSMPDYKTWAVFLAEELKETHPDIKFFNHAKGGTFSFYTVQIIDAVIQNFRPHVVYLCTCMNDFPSIPVLTVKANLQYVITQCQKHNIQVILGMMDLTHKPRKKEKPPEYIEAFNNIFPDLAEKYHLTTFDYVNEKLFLDPDRHLYDGFHPTNLEFELIAGRAKEALFKVLNIEESNEED